MTAQTILPANTLSSGYDVANSARFDQPDGADTLRLSAAGSNGDMKHWTISMWIKRSKLATEQHVWTWSANNTNAEGGFAFDANDQLFFINDGQNGSTNEIDGRWRDTSAWMHLVWSCDADNGTNANRWKVYINGVQKTITGGPTISDANGIINQGSTQEHWIGGRARSLNANVASEAFFSGYLAEVVFIDDATLDPTSFGEFDSDSPTIWKPIDVSGLTFGTEGYYLDFKNAAELGTDVSGNSNTFTESNISDVHQTTDTCTNNFATMNPLNVPVANPPVLSNGNLNLDSAANANKFHGSSTIGVSKGKWYMEFKPKSGSYSFLGITGDPAEDARNTVNPGYSVSSWGYYQDAGTVANNNSASSYGDSYNSSGDIIGVALNIDDNELKFYKNGTVQNSGTALSITAVASVPAGAYFFVMGDAASDSSSKAIANFGNPDYANTSSQADANGYGDFEHAPPSGFYSLCTKNLAKYG